MTFLHFQMLVSDKHVLMLTDNGVMKAHINRQGGTRSTGLILEASILGLRAERHLRFLTVEHISGVSNMQVDWLSWTVINHAEWHLHPSLFWELPDRFGFPEADMFATPDNSQLLRFYTRFPALRAEGIDALHSLWPPVYCMPFLLFPLFQG